MKKLLTLCVITGLLLATTVSFAATLEWNRNSESDMKQYNVYICRVAGCVSSDVGQTWVGVVSQPVVGLKPFFVLPDNVIGAVAVTAENVSGQKSGPSVSLPFTTVPVVIPVTPSIPTGLLLR